MGLEIMSNNYNRNDNEYPQQQQQQQQPRPSYILNPYSSVPVNHQHNFYYPSTVNNGNSAYVFDPQNYHPIIQQPSAVPQPCLQKFNDEVIPNEPDEFILDLLKKPQERLFLLKLELEFETFIKDKQRFRLDFPSMNSYQRLMIHRLAPYYKLNHFHDGMRKGVYVCKTDITELPEIRLLNIDVSEKTEEQQTQPAPMPAPQFKIMRRSAGSGSISPRSASSAGEDQSKNNAIDRKNMTLEERKTAYEEARARIFQGLEENKQQPE
ncbi:hypothetical protein G6F16_001784 [Rhizopus arrhizus]|nr:hypothetical protein G6F23_000501 [Rhizopus arrhizus]KAG0770426.1 hypothetical protein G6F24_000220 [Rhizopus arrhizus]KAG0794571.1 hypothetical protein G6F21_002767 [Rhizopus arrhizus]KAG0801612.1 hypothetical protein G6F22_001079 [Rhizopus arrhizus]KAG0815909.1 hypothetical protein G6F20_003622 [Rhizopus arrhizus]